MSQGTGGRRALSAPVGASGSNSGPMARPGTGPSRARSASGPNAFVPGASGPDAFGPNGSGPDDFGPNGSGPDDFGPNGSGADNFGPSGGRRSATGPHATRSGTGPHAARPGTGPHSARPGTGPHAARPGTGPNAVRPAAGIAQPNLSQPSLTQPTVAQPALAQRSPAQPSFQPNTNNSRGSGRQPEHGDWNERTERIDRIAPGYPDPRVNGRGHAASAPAAASIWGREDSADRRAQDPREAGRGAAGGGNGRRSTDDDPLTSKAFSREALVNTDGRSYRVASRRAQASPDRYAAALSEETETFTMTGQYAADAQAATAGYPVRGGQQPSFQASNRSGQQQSRQPRQPAPQDRGTASYPYPSQPYSSRPAAPDRDDERYGRPARPSGNEQGYNRNGGYSANGYSGNGHSANGHSANGHSNNGRSANGYSANGYSGNGYSGNGHSGNGHSANGYSGNGHLPNGYRDDSRYNGDGRTGGYGNGRY
jgi:hypothetical protein